MGSPLLKQIEQLIAAHHNASNELDQYRYKIALLLHPYLNQPTQSNSEWLMTLAITVIQPTQSEQLGIIIQQALQSDPSNQMIKKLCQIKAPTHMPRSAVTLTGKRSLLTLNLQTGTLCRSLQKNHATLRPNQDS